MLSVPRAVAACLGALLAFASTLVLAQAPQTPSSLPLQPASPVSATAAAPAGAPLRPGDPDDPARPAIGRFVSGRYGEFEIQAAALLKQSSLSAPEQTESLLLRGADQLACRIRKQ